MSTIREASASPPAARNNYSSNNSNSNSNTITLPSKDMTTAAVTAVTASAGVTPKHRAVTVTSPGGGFDEDARLARLEETLETVWLLSVS
jgi:hypothetical protein